jgi:tetratricopeptide (TPR) repeat protein
MLESALEHAKAANMPLQEREIAPLLFQARLYDGNYYEILQQADETLRTQAGYASPDVLLQLYSGRAEAKEALGDQDGALAELGTVLELLPRDRLYERIGIRCERAGMYASRAEWATAHEELDRAIEDSAATPASVQGDEGKNRGEALVKLVRANVHQALGEDSQAKILYEECERAFSDTGDTAFLVSALRCSIRCKLLLGDFGLEAARARLRDHLTFSLEYRRIRDKEDKGIATLAVGRLVEARSTLLQAISAAQRVHDTEQERGLRFWYADVLLAAGDGAGALRQYVSIGDAEKSAEVAKRLMDSVPGEPPSAFDELVAYAASEALGGSLHARRAALVALTAVADLLPEGVLGTLAAGLSSMDEWPAGLWADRNLLSEAAVLAQQAAPTLDDALALAVCRGVVRAQLRTDCFHTTYKPLCSALSSLAIYHPSILKDLGIPYDRLVNLVGGDLINDTRNAMAALVNLARIGDLEAKARALELARSGDTPWHVRWRRWLGDTSQEELSATIRAVLQGGIDRVRQVEGRYRFGIGGLSPTFFHDWDLPEEVKAEVASTLSEAASDSTARIQDRQEAATMLGTKASQLDAEGRQRAIESLLPLLAHEVEVHPVARSIDNPLSAMRMNMGQPDDIKAAAAYSLLRLSEWMVRKRRRWLMLEIEKLRASQIEAFGVSVGRGLRHFRPRDPVEQRWLQTRLLVLMNAPHSSVRDNAARCVGLLVREGVLEFNPEIGTTLVHLASSASVDDRLGASHALSGAQTSEEWRHRDIDAAFDRLTNDRSFQIRKACGLYQDQDEQSHEQAS